MSDLGNSRFTKRTSTKFGKVSSLTTRLYKRDVWQNWGGSLQEKLCMFTGVTQPSQWLFVLFEIVPSLASWFVAQMAMPLKPLKQQTCDPNASEKKKKKPAWMFTICPGWTPEGTWIWKISSPQLGRPVDLSQVYEAVSAVLGTIVIWSNPISMAISGT